jgi:flagellar hook protein FlgE
MIQPQRNVCWQDEKLSKTVRYDPFGVARIGLGGLQNAQDTFEKSAKRIANIGAQEADPATDIVDVISAKEAFQANARVIKVGKEMQKSLLDLLA